MRPQDLTGVAAVDEGGHSVTLSSFWADRTAVLALVRHFDSSACRKVVAALKDAQGEIDRRHVRLIVVGAARPEEVRDFREAVGYRGPMLVDPSLEIFRLAGLVGVAPAAVAPPPEKGSSGFFGRLRDSLVADVGKLLSKQTKHAMATDLARSGRRGANSDNDGGGAAHDSGVFAVGPGETIRFEWRAREAGDLPEVADLLAVLPAATKT